MRVRTKNSKINRAILTALALTVAGMLNAPMLVRGVLRELKKPKNKQRSTQNAIYAARGRLLREGIIEYSGGFFRLTDKGKDRLALMEARDYQLPKPRKWDKKWRLLIFDIKEEKKALRDKVRRTLAAIGFKRLQDSVWVYPYDCEDLIALLKVDFKIGKDVLYIIADEIENDGFLRKEFSLD